jgi:voltage-gated potassium channel
MENLVRLYDNQLKPMFGVLILLNILDQIMLSGSLIAGNQFLEIFYGLSMVLFVFELFLRISSEKKATLLTIIDAAVLINYFLIGNLDLRVLRIFRAYSTFNQHSVLFPANTLLKTVYHQRFALLGSQIMVFSVLLIFSTLIHFIEKDVYPEAFGSIISSMWFGITTLTTVGYGDITPVTSAGKILAAFTMFLGIGMFALPAAILASAYYEEIQKRNFLISLETISKVPLFEQLPVGAIGKINSKLHAVLVPPHKTIISKGEISDAMYIIEFGSVEVQLKEPVILSAGDYFGERGLILNETRNASITSINEVKILKLKKKDLLELMSEHESLFKELAHSSAVRSGDNY